MPRTVRREGLWTGEESHPTWTSEISCPSDEQGKESKLPLDRVRRETPLLPQCEAESPDPQVGNVHSKLNGSRTSGWWLSEIPNLFVHKKDGADIMALYTKNRLYGPFLQHLLDLGTDQSIQLWPEHSLAETAPSIEQVFRAFLPGSRSSPHWGPKGLKSPLPSFPEKRKPCPPPCPMLGARQLQLHKLWWSCHLEELLL